MRKPWSIRRVWKPYLEWEDFQHGMYNAHYDHTVENQALLLLSDQKRFFAAGSAMVAQWPVAALVNLTNTGSNRRAWVGQATCCYDSGAPERATRCAWKALPEAVKAAANKTADRIINEYEAAYRVLHAEMGRQMLFQWDTG